MTVDIGGSVEGCTTVERDRGYGSQATLGKLNSNRVPAAVAQYGDDSVRL